MRQTPEFVAALCYWHGHSKLWTVNDREFRQHLSMKRLEHQRQEAAAENAVTQPAAPKKSPTTAKALRRKKTRSA